MDAFFNRLRALWLGLSSGQRVRLVAALLATLGLVWGLSVYATRVRFAVLYSGLERGDAAAVTAALSERQAPYRLSAGGTIIEVPAGQVDELRLALAGDGLPAGGGSGFELFDKPAFGLSDFVQNVNYRRALERELARTIQSLDAVESARVHLALPPDSPFADEQRQPTASVVVRLRGAGSLSSGRVRSISHLVASGVEGLDPGSVSVIDAEGRLLSDTESDDRALSSSQVEAKRSMEGNIESRLVAILEPVVGPGRVRARATVELNMTRVQRTEERYDPNVAVVRSETKDKKKSSGSAGGGVPGTASNLPGGAATPAAGRGALDESQTTTTNFELNRTVSEIAEPVGTLARQSVAVVVDHAPVAAGGSAGAGGATPVPRSAEEMRKITDLVRAAIGYDEQRGDTLIVENVPFDAKILPDAGTAGGFAWDLLLRAARYASLPLAVLLLALLVIRPAIGTLRELKGTTPAVRPPTVADLQARIQAELSSGDATALIPGTSPLRRRLIEAVGQDPETAALVVRGWLDHRKSRKG